MAEIVCISDTHLHKIELPPADILVHAGDLTMQGEVFEVELVMSWFNELITTNQFSHIVFVPGNHDFLYEKNWDLAISLIKTPDKIHCLHNSGIEIDEVKFWGSGTTPFFYDWAFNVHRGLPIKKHWDLIPDNTDVLITHGPPYGYCDWVPRADHVGCEELSLALDRVEPLLHVTGHIHCARNYTKHKNGKTWIVNAAICNEKYKPVQKPFMIKFDITNGKKKIKSIQGCSVL